MTEPYYEADGITLYHGDCLEVTEWLAADVLITDPPYGINDRGGAPALTGPQRSRYQHSAERFGIQGDGDTSARDAALAAWGAIRPAVVFGSPKAALPGGVRQVLVWQKPANVGLFGTVAGFRRDWEAIYLLGDLPKREGAESAILRTRGTHPATGHRHAKPVSLMQRLCAIAPGTVADPFAGSGSTLLAARNLGRRAIGVEIEERYCELIARRLAQTALCIEAAL